MDTYVNNLRQRNDAIIRACQSVDPDFVVDGEDQDQERWTVCYNYSDGLGWLPVDNFFNLYGTAWVSTEEKAKEVCAVLTMWKTEELFRGEDEFVEQDQTIEELEALLEATRKEISDQLSTVENGYYRSIQSIDPTLYDKERMLEQAVIDAHLDAPLVEDGYVDMHWNVAADYVVNLDLEKEQDNELKKRQTAALKHWEKTFLEGGVDDEHNVFIAEVLAAERRNAERRNAKRRNLERRIEPCNKEQPNEI